MKKASVLAKAKAAVLARMNDTAAAAERKASELTRAAGGKGGADAAHAKAVAALLAELKTQLASTAKALAAERKQQREKVHASFAKKVHTVIASALSLSPAGMAM